MYIVSFFYSVIIKKSKVSIRLVGAENMSNSLNEKYKKTIEFLQNKSLQFHQTSGIEIEIQVLNDAGLNAMVEHIKDNTYRISFYSGCFNLDFNIEKITERYTKDDLIFFRRFKKIRAFECFEDDCYRECLNNQFATMILLHIFYHECGHIRAKHLQSSNQTYLEYDSTSTGNYEHQEREMVADWLGTKYLFSSIFDLVDGYDTPSPEELISMLKHMTVLYWLSLTIEFQIFDSTHVKKTDDFSTLTHPHPAVRLYYNLEAMHECMVDILKKYGLDDSIAEAGANVIIQDFYIYIESFLDITDAPIDIEKNDRRIIDCYIKLRDVPYKDNIAKNDYIHLEPLADKNKVEYDKNRDFVKNGMIL